MKIYNTEVKRVKIYKAVDLGVLESQGGKFLAFCTDHEQFVQGSRTSLIGRFTFEICDLCEYPREEAN
jgi:hypothetical protein